MRRTLAAVAVTVALVTGVTAAAPAALAAPATDVTAIARATPGADRLDIEKHFIGHYPNLNTCVAVAEMYIGNDDPKFGWLCWPITPAGNNGTHELWMLVAN